MLQQKGNVKLQGQAKLEKCKKCNFWKDSIWLDGMVRVRGEAIQTLQLGKTRKNSGVEGTKVGQGAYIGWCDGDKIQGFKT